MQDYSRFQAPLIGQREVTLAASGFREKYWNEPSPIDILAILEHDLRISITAVPGLEKISNTSAFITSDWKQLYIDQDQFMDERYDYRTNFSVAHEIGHLVLHRGTYELLGIDSIAAMYKFIDQCPGFEWYRLEDQAHAFAGRVLVPKNELVESLRLQARRVQGGEIPPQHVLKSVGKMFQVSEDVIKRRIGFEKISIDPETFEPV